MKNINLLFISPLVIFLSFAIAGQPNPAYLTAQQAAQWLRADKNVVVLDVRTPAEYQTGHLKNAVNIDYTAPDFAQQIAQLNPLKPYLVHCAVGGRSTKTMLVLQKMKFRDARHLDGGLQAWQIAGLPMVK